MSSQAHLTEAPIINPNITRNLCDKLYEKRYACFYYQIPLSRETLVQVFSVKLSLYFRSQLRIKSLISCLSRTSLSVLSLSFSFFEFSFSLSFSLSLSRSHTDISTSLSGDENFLTLSLFLLSCLSRFSPYDGQRYP